MTNYIGLICALTNEFHAKMRKKLFENLAEKGISWRGIDPRVLKDKLEEAVNSGNWVDVANYAFMLDEIESHTGGYTQ